MTQQLRCNARLRRFKKRETVKDKIIQMVLIFSTVIYIFVPTRSSVSFATIAKVGPCAAAAATIRAEDARRCTCKLQRSNSNVVVDERVFLKSGILIKLEMQQY